MSLDDDEREVLTLMRTARARARGYADFFGWAVDRDLEEWGVVSSLSESLERDGMSFFTGLKLRGRPNDPPDCEAVSASGQRIAIEVTELVDGDAIRAFKEGRAYDWADWNQEKFVQALAGRVSKKDDRFPELQGAPYDGGYVLVVHTDEPMLSRINVAEMLAGHRFAKPNHIDKAFLVLSYDPGVKCCPYFELTFDR